MYCNCGVFGRDVLPAFFNGVGEKNLSRYKCSMTEMSDLETDRQMPSPPK